VYNTDLRLNNIAGYFLCQVEIKTKNNIAGYLLLSRPAYLRLFDKFSASYTIPGGLPLLLGEVSLFLTI